MIVFYISKYFREIKDFRIMTSIRGRTVYNYKLQYNN